MTGMERQRETLLLGCSWPIFSCVVCLASFTTFSIKCVSPMSWLLHQVFCTYVLICFSYSTTFTSDWKPADDLLSAVIKLWESGKESNGPIVYVIILAALLYASTVCWVFSGFCSDFHHTFMHIRLYVCVFVLLSIISGPPSCPICLHLHHAELGLFHGWSFGMEWSPIGSLVTSKSILPEIPSAT